MQKFIAAIVKDFFIIIRDKAGLAIIFAMPMALVLIMTLLQDSAYRSLNESGIPIIYIDEDKDSLGLGLEKGLRASGVFEVTSKYEGRAVTREEAWKAVSEGKYLIGIVIPEGSTKAIRKGVKALVEQTLSSTGISGVDSSKLENKVADSIQIEIFIDPVTKKTHVMTVTISLREFISKIKSQIVFQTFSAELSGLIPVNDKVNLEKSDPLTYKEVYAVKQEKGILPNSVQHNVPAWSVFSMFFIIIPLASSIIMERGEGTAFRLKTISNGIPIVMISKVFIYTMVCLSQLLLMFTVGIYILPLMGLPLLQFGNSPIAIVLVALFTALAATCYGLMFGTITTTNQQAAIGGSVSVLIMAAIGGIWVPVHLMPQMMKTISKLSPLNWGLEAFHDIFLRGGGVAEVLPEIGLLFSFAVVTLLISYYHTKLKNNI